MARIRTAGVIAAVAAAPLAVAMVGGVAHADNGAIAADDSNALVVSGESGGGALTNQQVAAGPGASNQASNAKVSGPGVNVVDQTNATIVFGQLR